MPSKLCKLCNVSKIQLKTYVKCLYALINQLICIIYSECLIFRHEAFRAAYNSRSTKIGAPSAARILIQVRYANSKWIWRIFSLRCNLSYDNIYFFLKARSENGCGKWRYSVWNKVRIWRTWRHTPHPEFPGVPPWAFFFVSFSLSRRDWTCILKSKVSVVFRYSRK